jgi:hypothetical protein
MEAVAEIKILDGFCLSSFHRLLEKTRKYLKLSPGAKVRRDEEKVKEETLIRDQLAKE